MRWADPSSRQGQVSAAARTLFAGFVFLLLATPASTNQRHQNHSRPPIAGPHLSGDEYRALRRSNKFDAFVFTVTEKIGAKSKGSKVWIGLDMAIEQGPLETRIYDFKHNRLLKAPIKERTFSNDSLFGLFLMRWAYLQNNLRAAASQTVQISSEVSLKRYWHEQNNGMILPIDQNSELIEERVPRPNIRVQRNPNETVYSIGNLEVQSVRWSQESPPSPQHAKTFAAWSIWSLRLHADTVSNMMNSGRFPHEIKMLTNPESAPTAQSRLLQFSQLGEREGSMDVIKGRTSDKLDWKPWLSDRIMTQLISAVRGQAEKLQRSEDDTIAEVEALKNEGDHLSAVLLAVHASLPWDGCRDVDANPLLCGRITEIIRTLRNDATVMAYFEAIRLDQVGKHTDAVQALRALRSPNLARTDLLELAIARALVSAKRNGKLDSDLQDEFSKIPQAFETAFEFDPYNPARYRELIEFLNAAVKNTSDEYLANVYTYPVIDLARSLPGVRFPSVVTRANDMEDRIARDFPILFPGGAPTLSQERQKSQEVDLGAEQ